MSALWLANQAAQMEGSGSCCSRKTGPSSLRALHCVGRIAYQHSRLPSGASRWAVGGAALTRSCVRTRVASRLWCASRLHAAALLASRARVLTLLHESLADVQDAFMAAAVLQTWHWCCSAHSWWLMRCRESRCNELQMRGAHGGVCDEEALVLAHRLRPAGRSLVQEHLQQAIM